MCIFSLPASKLSYLGKRSEPRENARARGRGKESLQRSLINFHFHPGKSGTPQSVKTVTANVPQIRKVTTALKKVLPVHFPVSPQLPAVFSQLFSMRFPYYLGA